MNSIDHNGQFYIVRVTKRGRLITQYETHMQYTDNNGAVHLGVELKGTGCLEDMFIDASSVRHNRIFNLYAAGTQMKMFHNEM